jgi:hypothetical protein
MSSKHNKQEQYLYETILCKFIINLPSEELEDYNRLAYQVEKAFYYYLDYILCTPQIADWEG